jgi:hypothetical protein
MKAGDELRFRGPAGAEFVVTVGAAFDERTIKARIESGEWTPLKDAPAPEPQKRPARKTAAKTTAARKKAADTATDTSEGDSHDG